MRKKNKIIDTVADAIIKANHTSVFRQIGTVGDAVKSVLIKEKVVSVLPDCDMKDMALEDYERAKGVLKTELSTYTRMWSDYNSSLNLEDERNATKEWTNRFPTALKLLYQEVEKCLRMK